MQGGHTGNPPGRLKYNKGLVKMDRTDVGLGQSFLSKFTTFLGIGKSYTVNRVVRTLGLMCCIA